MLEVRFKIKFTTPCLGNVRPSFGTGLNKMLKDSDGRVVFMASWFHIALRRSARSVGQAQHIVDGIQWSPVMDGALSTYDRVWTNRKAPSGERHGVTRHEAFLPGTVVAGSAVLPDFLDQKTFSVLMSAVGKFIGLSPYGHRQGFGRFEIVEVSDASSGTAE